MDQLAPVAAQLIQRQMDRVRSTPRSGEAWGVLGATLASFDYRREALFCLETAERFEPGNPRWPHLQATLLAAEAPEEAAARWRRAVALCGSEPDAPRLRLARHLAELGRAEEARREWEALLRDKPGHAPALLALARLAQLRGEPHEALSLASRCTEDARTRKAAWTLTAMLHQRLGDTNAAQRAGARAAALPLDASEMDSFGADASERSDPRDLSDRAQRWLMAGKPAEAAPIIDQLVREHPGFAEGWLLLGRRQLLGQDAAAAERSIRKHLAMEPQSVNGLFQLGMALLAQQKNPDAAEAFEHATRLKPDFGPAFYNLGLARARSGQKREAVPAFRAAIRHNPERIDSYILLADLHLQLGEKAAAVELAREAEALNPADRRLPTLREKIGQTER